MQLWQYCLLVTARLLYMFRTLSASIIRSTKNLLDPYWIHTIPIHGMHQWLLLQFSTPDDGSRKRPKHVE